MGADASLADTDFGSKTLATPTGDVAAITFAQFLDILGDVAVEVLPAQLGLDVHVQCD